jgi:hypothetical protein
MDTPRFAKHYQNQQPKFMKKLEAQLFLGAVVQGFQLAQSGG